MTSGDVRSVIAAGYAPLDIVSYAGRFWHSAGGTAGNVAAILGFLGWDSTLVADFGDDLAGDRARRDLAKANVQVRPVAPRDGFATPRIVHEIGPSSHTYRYSCPTCAQRLPPSRPLTIAAARLVIDEASIPDVFFFDRLNPGTILLAEHFAQAGSTVMFEPSRPSRADLTTRALAVADIVKTAEDRATSLDDVNTVAARRQIRIETRGGAGARYRVGAGPWHESHAFDYPVVDPGGAGDWTTAGLLDALSSVAQPRPDIGEALSFAQALAAVSCGSPGARGLARQQTAAMVMRSAAFLSGANAAEQPSTRAKVAALVAAPEKTCPWCLLPVASSAAGSEPAVAGTGDDVRTPQAR